MAAYTTADLLASIKRSIIMPAFQGQFSNADLLAFADEEMHRRMLPMLTSLKDERYTIIDNVAISSGTSEYAIPVRTIGRGTRELKLKDSDTSTNRTNLARITVEDEHYHANSSSNDPFGYLWLNDKIRLVPSPSSAGVIEIWYNLRPGKLVETSKATTITAIDIGNSQITVAAVPSTFTSGVELDIIPKDAGNFPLQIDNAITLVNSTTLTLETAPLSTVSVGDYVSLADSSPVLQVPQEMMQLLSLMVQCRVLSAIGDTEMLGKMEQEREMSIKNALNLLDPRNEGERKKVVNRNGLVHGIGRYFHSGSGIV